MQKSSLPFLRDPGFILTGQKDRLQRRESMLHTACESIQRLHQHALLFKSTKKKKKKKEAYFHFHLLLLAKVKESTVVFIFSVCLFFYIVQANPNCLFAS